MSADDLARLPKPATHHTAAANEAVTRRLPFEQLDDFERATRGRLAEPATAQVVGASGWPVWDLDAYAFLDGDCPPSVNPSLWRQARLNAIAGLFEITDDFYQVRGLDLSNITFVAGDTGWVVIDPLTSAETARAALALANATLGERPVRAVIYTHSHVDHYAGVHGVVDPADVASGDVPILAPVGFLEAAVSENVNAGNVMSRRATYMYGPLLPRGPQGHVDAGLGKGIPLMGSQGLIAPTDEIRATGEERVLDGVRIVFQLTPGTEAPAEMNFHFPERRVLCMAENCTATLHNLYTPRGAQVRDALAWSTYIGEAIDLFAEQSDVLFASHHWPRWGADDLVAFLQSQQDLYRYLHDQTLRLANQGHTMVEIAEMVELPEALGCTFACRDYYGTVNHNVKAVYQRYLGWFDGNPAHLHPHPPTEAARRYVAYMGGADEVLAKARVSFDEGDYRWVAEVVNHVVFADPDNHEARLLQADTLEQLGYQAESGPWRDFYLTGAQELRHGPPASLPNASVASADTVAAMTCEMLLDLIGVRLNGPAAADARIEVHLVVSDRDEQWVLGVRNGTVHMLRAPTHSHAEQVATTKVTLTHAALAELALGRATPSELADRAVLEVHHGADVLDRLVGLLDTFEFWFPIVTP